MADDVQPLISLESRVVASRRHVSADLSDQAVILNLADGVYYGLNPLGAEIWAMIQQPQPVAVLRDHVLEAYHVTPDQCERDLLALLQDLARAGLITVH